MKDKNEVRLGVIGVGNMGSGHAKSVLAGSVPRCRLTAVSDVDPARLAAFGDANVLRFEDSDSLIRSGEVDAVLIATPHYAHTTVGIAALEHGLHVLVEKPISVHKADCQRLIAAHRKDGRQVFAAMFNQRTDPHYVRAKKLVDDGELGPITRVNWIITNWFRTAYYYARGGWRATWAGEGGGVLLNQCPHQLDMIQWICGMPRRVTAFCALGKWHEIEVEDEVTAFLEYPNGATGIFITSTGEAPGTNRLEIVGDRGKVVVEDGKVRFTRNEVPTSVFNRTAQVSFDRPEVWHVDLPTSGHGGQHNEILRNFTAAILDGAALIAPASDGIHSVELGNAMLYSSLLGKPVDLPLDGEAFERRLKKLIKTSTFRKPAAARVSRTEDMSKSFA